MSINIDYKATLPIALKAIFPDESERAEAKRKLEKYGIAPFHREESRVRLAVLYLASQEPDKLDFFIELACSDYRDLLCAAEYPHSSRRRGLQTRDPKRYKKLQVKEEQEYLAWIEGISQA